MYGIYAELPNVCEIVITSKFIIWKKKKSNKFIVAYILQRTIRRCRTLGYVENIMMTQNNSE